MIRVEVETVDDRVSVLAGCYVLIDPTYGDALLKKEDNYAALLGNKQAWVSVPVVETQGGPGFSSIKVGVEISVHVDQNETAIKRASELLIQEGLMFCDEHIRNAHAMLCAHRDDLDLGNGDGE